MLTGYLEIGTIVRNEKPQVDLSSLHRANSSWQTRVGKLKLVCVNSEKTVGKHILFVANSLPTCLLAVFAPFTHTNLSFPTRVCQLEFAV